MKRLILILTYWGATMSFAHAQFDQTALDQLVSEDSADIFKLAGYPVAVRQDIFEACAAPQAVADLQAEEKKSNQQFKDLLERFSLAEQKKIWNLMRYNNLINSLVGSGKKSKSYYEAILYNYPKAIRSDALYYALHHFKLLENANRLNMEFSSAFQNIIDHYPSVTQNALSDLLKTPEVVNILNNNISITVHLGNIYQHNPALLQSYFESLNQQLTVQKKQDVADWQQTLKNDPQAQTELVQSAQDYAQDEGEAAPQDDGPVDPAQADDYSTAPYPYWCGYPWWYDYENWYPDPAWYDCGFYYQGGNMVCFGLPSWGFMHWNFWHSSHFFGYPHLTNAFVGFYDDHHRAEPYGNVVVHQWLRQNSACLPKDFMQNPRGRLEAINEYGKFSNSYAAHRAVNGAASLPPDEYMRQHSSEYSHLQVPAASHSNAEYGQHTGGNGGMHPAMSYSGRVEQSAVQSPHSEWINSSRPQSMPSFHSAPRYNVSPAGGGFHSSMGGGGFHSSMGSGSGGGFHGGGGGGFHGGGGGGRR